MSGFTCIDLCGIESKAQQVPKVLAAFANALRESRLNRDALDNAIALGMVDLQSIWRLLRTGTIYANDPPCWDYAQSFATSIERQRTEGVFGDCGAYAVAVSALAERLGHGAGQWLLLGDANDPAQHIVNLFYGNLVVDATVPNGFAWHIPERFSVRTLIDPNTGEALHV